MGWGRIDDRWDESEAVLALMADHDGTDAGRIDIAAAAGLWSFCFTWANRNTRQRGQTPGLLPANLPASKLGTSKDTTARLVALLVHAGLWQEVGSSGWLITGFAATLPSAELAKARSEAGRRGAESRWGKTRDTPGQDTLPGAVPAEVPPQQTAKSRVPEALRADVEQVCAALADAIAANGSKRPNITETWRREARLLLDNDLTDRAKKLRKTPVELVLAAINYSQRDNFWKGNILSMPKLREKYDTLRLRAEAGTAGGPPSQLRGATTRPAEAVTPDDDAGGGEYFRASA